MTRCERLANAGKKGVGLAAGHQSRSTGHQRNLSAVTRHGCDDEAGAVCVCVGGGGGGIHYMRKSSVISVNKSNIDTRLESGSCSSRYSRCISVGEPGNNNQGGADCINNVYISLEYGRSIPPTTSNLLRTDWAWIITIVRCQQ